PVAIVEASGTAPERLSAPTRPPTGPGSPAALPAHRRRHASKQRRPGVIRLTPPPAEERIVAVLAVDPEVSIWQLARRASVSQATASKWRALHFQQRAEPREAAAQ